MALQERHRWMAMNIALAFDMHGREREVENFLSDPREFKKINEFLDGKSKHRHFFVYHQKPDARNEFDEIVDAKVDPKFFYTTGDHEEVRIKDRAVYFVRNVPEMKSIRQEVASDGDLLFGEMTPCPLDSFNTGLNGVFKPLIFQAAAMDWGMCDDDQAAQFRIDLDRFTEELAEGLKSMNSAIDLPAPEPTEIDVRSMNHADIMKNHPEIVQQYETLLETWCRQIEQFLEDTMDGQQTDDDSGPRTELEFWRNRLQQITSITEQLKTKERKQVFSLLNSCTRANETFAAKSRTSAFHMIRQWKQVDILITEAWNEAKDNVKYLTTLEKFIEPLYVSTPSAILDTLPALMNAVKLIHTIARYYSTTERMTNLFVKITNQMITNCKKCVLDGEEADGLWKKDPLQLIKNLDSCIQLNQAYQAQYLATKESLLTLPKGKHFDFSETLIFGHFNLFCRRVTKLIDMFQTIHQFESLSQHRFDGMEPLVRYFKKILEEFQRGGTRNDMLNFQENQFDRDYVQFNLRIEELENDLKHFINQSFDSVSQIESSLNLLEKFRSILQRESLRADLDSKFSVIFQNYGLELTQVQDQYEKLKGMPPIVRDLPPIAGTISWSRHLFKRIEGPMDRFSCSPQVISSKDAKKLIRMYNRMAKTLIEFETVYATQWVQGIDAVRAGLQATLLVRHMDDGNRFHVNFDMEILQLIRETKCLTRMGSLEIPESAKMILLQEQKFKTFHYELAYFLKEYRRITQMVKPILGNLMKPHVENLEYKMRPGLVTLTWTSMNIEGFLESIWAELDKLEQLVSSTNDLMENRIDANLKLVSNVLLVDLPEETELVALDDFVEMQDKHVRETTELLVTKSVEIQNAVDDLLAMLVAAEIDSHVAAATEGDIIRVKTHYNWSVKQALLNATVQSLTAMKLRLSSNKRIGATSLPPAFFEVDLQLDGLSVRLVPAVEEIQSAINKGAVAVLRCSKRINLWDTSTPPEKVQLLRNPSLPPVQGNGSPGTFFDKIAEETDILKVVLLLTGSIQSTKNRCDAYVETFTQYEWCWKNDIAKEYKNFMATEPTLDEFEAKLKHFFKIEEQVEALQGQHQISALMLQTGHLSQSLKEQVRKWREAFASELHKTAFAKLESVSEMVKNTKKKLSRDLTARDDIDGLAAVMQTLQDVRAKQSEIELDIVPIEHMYRILEEHLPHTMQNKDEQDARAVLNRNWEELVAESTRRQEELSASQVDFKKELIVTVNAFKRDVAKFRVDYERTGPMVRGIPPKEAEDRLKIFKEEYEVRARKQASYYTGEDLFGLKHQQYPMLEKTKQELEFLTKLYSLYSDVIDSIKEWKEYLWTDVDEHMAEMEKKAAEFEVRCKRMPKELREWPAYNELKQEIESFKEVLPLLQDLNKKSIMPRHWQQVIEITGKELAVESEDFKLQSLIDAQLHEFTDEIQDICDSADKQLVIEGKLREMTKQWEDFTFDFGTWKTRDVPCMLVGVKVVEIQEALEETMMQLTTNNASRHSLPFKEELTTLLKTLSDTNETIEKWFKVQQMWTSLESVFTGGDIAKAMPMEAKKFVQIDRDWLKIMAKSAETKYVVPCCQNDMLIQMLEVLSGGLETCQRSLESYLEGKRNKFPRFYFTSDPVLLKILSQGSDPECIQEDFEKLFDAINKVTFSKMDPKLIIKIKGVLGPAEETVDLQVPVHAVGNIEDWLLALEAEMQRSVRRECRVCALEVGQILSTLTMQDFGNKTIAQVAILGIQTVWTSDTEYALKRHTKERQILRETRDKNLQMLADLVAICLTDLKSKMIRTKYETLVTIHVHQKDLFLELLPKIRAGKVKDENDFEWLKQTRLYWKTETDNAIISIADVDFGYSYEYLGCKERLVITALTDRCYVTQSQALGMFFGGAPAGPAGTGKTETTKDMGRTLGVFVVVTNCSDQHRFKDMAKIFKGLCMSGLWGCFDEFNRIELEVLSVVAMQVESICTAKRLALKAFWFPGEAAQIKLVPSVGYFITMNPGYAGRQELPENLKVLFRSVAMMVPNRETIMKVKLASVGYSAIEILGKKFCILYALCEQQLSKQRHYDFGLRNILSVLRNSGSVKRSEPPTADEEMLFMRTARDMNLSKLVADDVPLFEALLQDLFPKVTNPPVKVYKEIEVTSKALVAKNKLIDWPSWFKKVIQLYETSLVRHGFMLVGPTLCGKTEIATILTSCLTENGSPHRENRMNPKAITDSQMYGYKDPISEEWTPGVFAEIWRKSNKRENKYTTWIVCDGPVDAIWIENLNTVLDDNKILTLANSDRIPMTENCRIVFEVQDLRNASPATVSRAGIIYVSASDLSWEALMQSWLIQRPDLNPNRAAEADILKGLLEKWLKTAPPNGGAAMDLFDWCMRNIKKVMPANDSIVMVNTLNILSAALKPCVEDNYILSEDAYRRVLCWSVMWGFGGLLEPDERKKLWAKFAELLEFFKHADAIPKCREDETIFEFAPDPAERSRPWKRWVPGEWKPPKRLQFSALLIPTMDSCRADYLMTIIGNLNHTRTPPCFKSSMMTGAPGTAKTSTALMYMSKFSTDAMLSKRLNLSSATTPFNLQKTIEGEMEKKGGRTFVPPGGKTMTIFIDDASMPLVNKWGDQVTNELSRQLIEMSGFYFLHKEKRGEFMQLENLQYIGAMGHPGGGKEDIPNRLKSKFFCFNMVLPSTVSVDSIFGSIMKVKFSSKAGAKPPVMELTTKLCGATVDVWDKVKRTLLPTPLRFHYIFNMRDLSRVFQGIMECPVNIVKDQRTLVALWKHEVVRVFADKLCRDKDKAFVDKAISEFLPQHFGEDLAAENEELTWFADFQQEMQYDDETGEEIGAPKVYEPAYSWEHVKNKAYYYLEKFNVETPQKAMNLVLFDAAMMHLMKINRTIQQKRGSAMLVGVGGSGKQSLARLAAYISGHYAFQITITKFYNDNALFEDLKALVIKAGVKGEHVTFIFTDAEVKSENFLEYMNSLLATGEVVGLLGKDDKDTMCGDVRNDFVKECPGVEENMLNMFKYLMDRIRDLLHICLCFSPVNAKFPIRAQKFPAVFAVNINWFMPWPEDALVAVSTAFLSSFSIDTTDEDRKRLYGLTGYFQASVRDMCAVYKSRMRKDVYVTPKSFLCLIDFYKVLYKHKYDEINVQERSVNIGLMRLKEAAEFVQKLKLELKEQEVILAAEAKKVNALLEKVTREKASADKQEEAVNAQAAECQATEDKINVEKEEAQKELNAAMPFLYQAEEACKSITPADVTEVRSIKKPMDIIKLTFDGILILQKKMVCDVVEKTITINKVTATFIQDSYEQYSFKELDMNFLKKILYFAAHEKDGINDETCELLEPYLRVDVPEKNWSPFSHKILDPDMAGNASKAAKGLCTFVGAMVDYHKAAKFVTPKINALKVAEGRLRVAKKEGEEAQARLREVQAVVAALNAELTAAQNKMNALQEDAAAMKRQMDAAEKLLDGLSGENSKWQEDSKNFMMRRKRLVGDVAAVCAFVTYVGPFNSEFRDRLYADFLHNTCKREVPAHQKVDIVTFLADQGTIGEWALEGLPSDELSIQNAIMVTRSSRYPLMIDPQGQANRWIRNREKHRISQNPHMCITTLAAKALKDQVEATMRDGLCLLIENVENEVDPMLDPVMEKQIIYRGKRMIINVSDQNFDYDPRFTLYMTSRLPNPHFSPELSAKVTVIDFTVTLKGLEQQLLGRLISMEQKSLEDTLAALEEDVTNNKKALQLLNKQLLERLATAQGNLLEDTELIEVLANTKAKGKEVEGKLRESDERKIEINEKREQFRAVATRGSIMYFNMVDMTNVVNPITAQMSGWMYNCSLLQFLGVFEMSVRTSEKCQPTAKRVDKIIQALTYNVYRYMNRGLFERDKMMFKLIVTLKVMVVANQISTADVSIFLKAGSSLDVKAERQNPFRWMQDKIWLNLLQLTRHGFGPDNSSFFKELIDFIQRPGQEAIWKKWFDENDPESQPIPDYEERIRMEKTLGPFLRLVLVRCMREDRTSVTVNQFIEQMLDSRFTAPVTDAITDIYEESTPRKPVLYLLTAGSDPTMMIDELAKKKKKFPTDKVSMGEGQEKVAREKNNNAFLTGGWVILQNSHLGIGYMSELEDVLTKTKEIEDSFRLWITCEITPRFPIGLLQIAIKVTLEPPAGLKAGLARTYSTMVSQETLDKIDHEKWRTLVYVLAFLHSVVQERRKFGPIGWCVPYEYNNSDLLACQLFLERHVSNTILVGQPISWITVQYMIAQAQYGGRITDDLDRELFDTYTQKWMQEGIFSKNFQFNDYQFDYDYKVPEGMEIQNFRESIDTIPPVDSPMIFGLHINADLTYRMKEASEMIATIVETQPKDTGGGTGKSVDDIVKEQALELMSKMPPDFVEEIFRAQVQKLKGAPNTPDKGLLAPLNIFLFQELQRLQNIINIVRTNLSSITMAIDGMVVMTTDIQEDLGSIFDARVPRRWTHDPSGAEISWIMPNLGTWFTGLLDRQIMLNTWLENGRAVMKAFWLTGFTNAQGFITGMRQEVTRQHKQQQWALDDVISHTQVLDVDHERLRDVPDEGQNIHGLFIEGCKWNKQEKKLEESEPKQLFTKMPAILITGAKEKELRAQGISYGPFGAYYAPVYKYPKRNDRYLIFRINLKSDPQPPSHWKLRGVCLVAQTE